MTERTDWVLLLPLDRGRFTGAVVDGPADVGESLVSLGVAESWRTVDEEHDAVPLLVAPAGARHDPVDLVDLLTADGVLYAEIPRHRLHRTASGLERAGLSVVSVHGIAPDVATPRRYVPLDSSSALSWYIRALVMAPTPGERVARSASLAGLRFSRRWAPLLVGRRFGHVAVVATVGAANPRSDRVSEIVLTSGQDVGSRSVVLSFPTDAPWPRSVTKVAMRADAAETTRREGDRMHQLRGSLPYALASAIPRPIGERSLPVGTASVETCARGVSLQAATGRCGRPLVAKLADLRAAVDWFVAFGNSTVVMGGIETPSWISMLREAAELMEPTAPVRDLLARTTDHLLTTPRCQRSVHLHGDPGPWNIHADGRVRRRIGVIDWEHDGVQSPLGPPLVDIIYLATYWAFAARRTEGRSAEERTLVELFGPHQPSRRDLRGAREIVDDAAGRVGLGRADVAPLAVTLWARQAIEVRRRQDRLGTTGGAEPSRPEAYLSALAAAWEGPTSE